MTDPNQLAWNQAIDNENWAEAERLQDFEVHQRLESVYNPYFDANPDKTWVMVGNTTGDIYGGGTDEQMIDEEAYAAMEATVGEKVHLFGRPFDVGLDGLRPTFPD